MRGKEVYSAPYTKLNVSVLDLLKKEGFVSEFDRDGSGINQTLKITLKYDEGKAAISDVKRVSKLSRRIYLGSKDIKAVRNGYGLLVLSTPNGILSGKQAQKANVGGEALFEIW